MESNNQLLFQIDKRVSARRKALGFTQEQPAEKNERFDSDDFKSRTRQKTVRPENIMKLCSVLEISADYLLTGNNSNDIISEISDKLTRLSPESLKAVR